MARERFNKPGHFQPFLPKPLQLAPRLSAPLLRDYVPPRVIRRPGSDHSHIPSMVAGRRYYRGEA